ncbi:MAG TPA: 3'-5' exonuclease, partial [Bacteroidia bacterium]
RNEVDPFNILALTFTNKAAREMKERITHIVGDGEARNLWMGTFHSVFARILRYEHDKLNYPANFTIYDTDDSKNLIKSIVKQMELDDKVYKPSSVLARISQMKTNLLSFEAYQHNSQYTEHDRMTGRPHFGSIFETYCKRCFKAGAMDFDDILYNTSILLRDFPDVLYKYQNKFRYILVDEYQDTNFVQYVIIKQLAARFENICVVGDDAQSIYAFRGANIQNILNFKSDYPDVRTFKLEQNYRSTKNIVNAANSLITKNKNQIPKEIWTDNDEGEKIKVVRALTDNEEGMKVAQMIFESMMQQQMHPKEFAILYRTNAQSRAMEEALRKKNIAYRIYGGLSFYHRKEIKDLLAYFRLTINNHDEEAMKRVINYPARGIGNTTVDKIIIAANDHNISLFTVMDNLNDFNLEMNSGTRQRISDFVTMIKSFSAMLPITPAFDLGNHIASSTGILKDLYNDKSPEGVSRYENIEELLGALKEFSESSKSESDTNPPTEENFKAIDLPVISFENNAATETQTSNLNPPTLDSFMSDIALLTDSDKKDEPENRDHVSLMTIHQAKGLEFSHVFIVGLEENLFPNTFNVNSRDDMEEERRLFYVALTRAQKKSTLTYAATRFHRGSILNTEPSRFIEEIESKFLEFSHSARDEWREQRNRWQESGRDTTYEEPVYRKSAAKIPKPEMKSMSSEFKAQKAAVKKNLINATVAKHKPTTETQEHLKDLQIGMIVQHDRFGNGKVLNMEGVFPNSKATVEFESEGQKQLLLKFAKLKIVG